MIALPAPSLKSLQWMVTDRGLTAPHADWNAPADVRFRVLGGLELRGPDGGWRRMRQSRPRMLLAVLLARANHVVSAGDLECQLWPENPPRSARKLVQQYIHLLRQVIGDPTGTELCTDPPGYQLRLGKGGLDADKFVEFAVAGHRALADGAPQLAASQLREALGTWRDNAYCDTADAPLVRAEAARLDECRMVTTELWICAELECGRHRAMVPELESLVLAHPLRERLYQQLMVALCQSGRRAESLAVVRHLRRKLRDELGIEPGQEVRDLERAILRQDYDAMP